MCIYFVFVLWVLCMCFVAYDVYVVCVCCMYLCVHICCIYMCVMRVLCWCISARHRDCRRDGVCGGSACGKGVGRQRLPVGVAMGSLGEEMGKRSWFGPVDMGAQRTSTAGCPALAPGGRGRAYRQWDVFGVQISLSQAAPLSRSARGDSGQATPIAQPGLTC